MDGLKLLQRARAAGLIVSAHGDILTIRGSAQAEPVAQELIANKRAVLDALQAEMQKEVSAPADLQTLQQQIVLKHSGEAPTAARERWFRNLSASEKTQFGRFHGIWLPKKALVIGGCVLLAFVGFAVMWNITRPTKDALARDDKPLKPAAQV